MKHADAAREPDDVGLVYQAACGGHHWRCYLCPPTPRTHGGLGPRRSGHHDSLQSAAEAFNEHVRAQHPEQPPLTVTPDHD